MYRALFAADLHLGNTLPFAQRLDSSVYTDRLRDSAATLTAMADYAEANGITDLWYDGDLLDRRLLDAATLKVAVETLLGISDRGLTQRLIPGNHDAQDAAGTMYTLRGFEGIRANIEVWNEDTWQELGGMAFCAVPYKPDAQARDIIRRLRDDHVSHRPTVILIHQNIVGGKVGGWVCPDGVQKDDLEGFACAIAGHFHTPQEVFPGVRYLGAPLQHNFGDAGEQRGFWDITFTPAGTRARLVPLAAPRFHEADVILAAGDWDKQVRAAIGSPQPDDYIRIKYTGTAAEVKASVAWMEGVRAKLLKDSGARLVKLAPSVLPAHKVRARLGKAPGATASWPGAVHGYLDACDVTGLNRARLEALAAEALAEAEK